MNREELEKRTLDFSIQLVAALKELPKDSANIRITEQLIKSGTSIGANYREANRARSRADFKNKIKICESEASETQYWLEVIVEVKWLPWEKVKLDYDECSELLAIFTSIGKSK